MKIDPNILNDCKKNKRAAQKQLYKILLPYLKVIALRYLSDTSYVKDVLQESFVKIFKSLNTFDEKRASIKSWSSKIVINTCLNFNERVISKLVIKEELNETDILYIPQIVNRLNDEQLLAVLKKMPPDYYSVFNLFLIEGYSHDEIASLLKINPALSRKRLSRAREWVKKTFPEKAETRAEVKTLKRNIKN